MPTRKIFTDKYEVYVDGGQVYTRSGDYVRAITESQIDYLRNESWGNPVKKSQLDRLIESDFAELKHQPSIVKAPYRPKFSMDDGESMEVFCKHYFKFIEKTSEGYTFCCNRCLSFTIVAKPIFIEFTPHE